ncbi:uncharacterized protein LOC126584600 [Malus sylvestris]|uniref:uncharacterized protein LOC126584600 n=1 Tax=Malus sylvestris TaxID=3752 RepID=UPI0021AC2274|nr:uncharacterized protein LOC126584600 [Malus sylvestris]
MRMPAGSNGVAKARQAASVVVQQWSCSLDLAAMIAAVRAGANSSGAMVQRDGDGRVQWSSGDRASTSSAGAVQAHGSADPDGTSKADRECSTSTGGAGSTSSGYRDDLQPQHDEDDDNDEYRKDYMKCNTSSSRIAQIEEAEEKRCKTNYSDQIL